jgi:hypothetical protein
MAIHQMTPGLTGKNPTRMVLDDVYARERDEEATTLRVSYEFDQYLMRHTGYREEIERRADRQMAHELADAIVKSNLGTKRRSHCPYSMAERVELEVIVMSREERRRLLDAEAQLRHTRSLMAAKDAELIAARALAANEQKLADKFRAIRSALD